MRFYDKNSWKKKTDPAFDKPVKTYLKYLYEIEDLPNDGQITFKDESVELIRKDTNLLADYENEFENEMLHVLTKI